MTYKKLWVSGVFGLALMGATEGTSYQVLASTGTDENILLVSGWCERHPHHKKCHHHHGFPYGSPYSWYHESFNETAKHCQHHPYSSLRCERFCHMNPRICFH